MEHGRPISTLLNRRGFISGVVFLASLILLGAVWLVRGDVEAAVRPDSDDFVSAGEAIIHWMASGGAGLESMRSHAVFPRYLIPSVVLAGIYMNFSEPVVKVVALNVVLFSTTVVLLYHAWIMVHGMWTRWAGRQGFVLAGIGGFYIAFGLPDPFLFSYTVSTDTVFLFWVAAFVAAVTRGILTGGHRPWLIAFLMAALAPYVRPTGLLLPVLFLYALGAKALLERGVSPRTVAVISIGIPVGIVMLIAPWLVSAKINESAWVNSVIPELFRSEFNQAVHFFKTGIIVSDRPDTYVNTPSSYLDVLKMILYRLVYYLVPLRFGDMPYSMMHNAVNLVYVLIAWPLLITGVKRLIKSGRRHQALALFLVLVSTGYTLLHSVTLLSFGWRYQLPAMVPLWILAGVGLFSLFGYPVRPRNMAKTR